MKAKKTLIMTLSAVMMCLAASCAAPAPEKTGVLTDALDNSEWNESVWISAANAPVVTGRVGGGNLRAADGASWFVSCVKNDQSVASAKWMTTGLGVYQLFLNGIPVGDEILKPGFTHYAKTKRSFTYDVTEAFNKKSGAENILSVQVTPGWWADKIVTPGGHEGMIGKPASPDRSSMLVSLTVRSMTPASFLVSRPSTSFPPLRRTRSSRERSFLPMVQRSIFAATLPSILRRLTSGMQLRVPPTMLSVRWSSTRSSLQAR